MADERLRPQPMEPVIWTNSNEIGKTTALSTINPQRISYEYHFWAVNKNPTLPQYTSERPYHQELVVLSVDPDNTQDAPRIQAQVATEFDVMGKATERKTIEITDRITYIGSQHYDIVHGSPNYIVIHDPETQSVQLLPVTSETIRGTRNGSENYYERHENFIQGIEDTMRNNHVPDEVRQRIQGDTARMWQIHLQMTLGAEYTDEARQSFEHLLPFINEPNPYDAYGRSLLQSIDTHIPDDYTFNVEGITEDDTFEVKIPKTDPQERIDKGILSAFDGRLKIFLTGDNRLGVVTHDLLPSDMDYPPIQILETEPSQARLAVADGTHAELNQVIERNGMYEIATASSDDLTENGTSRLVAIQTESETIYLELGYSYDFDRSGKCITSVEVRKLPGEYAVLLDSLREIHRGEATYEQKELAMISEANRTLQTIREAYKAQHRNKPDTEFDDHIVETILTLMEAAPILEGRDYKSPLLDEFKQDIYTKAGLTRLEELRSWDGRKNRQTTGVDVLEARAQGAAVEKTQRTLTPKEVQELEILESRFRDLDYIFNGNVKSFIPHLRELFLDGRKKAALEKIYARVGDRTVLIDMRTRRRKIMDRIHNRWFFSGVNDFFNNRKINKNTRPSQEKKKNKQSTISIDGKTIPINFDDSIPVEMREQLLELEQRERQRNSN